MNFRGGGLISLFRKREKRGGPTTPETIVEKKEKIFFLERIERGNGMDFRDDR